MTPAQLAVFKTALLADVSQTADVAAGNHGKIAGYFNTVPASPVMVWRPGISISELNTAVVWADYKALTVASQNTYMAMISSASIDATSPSVRAGFQAVFGAGATLTNLTAIAQRPATRLEALFTVSGVSSVFSQKLTVDDVINALEL